MRIDNAQFTGSATGTQATATLSGSFSGSHEGTGARLTEVTASKLLFSASYGLGIENTFDFDATSNQSISVDTGSAHFISGVEKVADSTVDTGSFMITSSDAKASTGQIIFEQGDGTLFSQSIVAASTVGSLTQGDGVDAFSYIGSGPASVSISVYSASAATDLTNLSSSLSGTSTDLTNLSASLTTTDQSISSSVATLSGSASDARDLLGSDLDTVSASFSTSQTALSSSASDARNVLGSDLDAVSASFSTSQTALSASLTTTDQTISASLAALSGSASDARDLLTGGSTAYSASFNARINANDVDILGLNVYSASLKDAITVSGDSVTVLGDLTVNGTRTIVNSTEVNIGDNTINLNGVAGALKGGIEVNDPSGPVSGSLLWDSATNYWIAGPSQSESRILTSQGLGILSSSAQIAGDISGSFTLVSASFSTSQTALSSSASDARDALGSDLDAVSASFSTSQTALSASVATDITTLSGSTSTAREDYFNDVSVSTTTNTITLTKGDGTTSVENLVSSSYALTASYALKAEGAGSVVDSKTYDTSIESSTFNFLQGTFHIITTAVTGTLPPTPDSGDRVAVMNLTTGNPVVGRNGSNIMAVAQDLSIDSENASFQLIYTDATNGWILLGANN